LPNIWYLYLCRNSKFALENLQVAESNRMVRLLRDPAYREHVRQVTKLFRKYPKGFWYKGAALVVNQTNRVTRNLNLPPRVYCPVCDWRGSAFDAIATFGYWRRNARCPQCGALERHRAMIVELERRDLIHRGTRCLDVGGISAFERYFRARAIRYTSLSLGDPANVCMDVQTLGFPNQCFDLILDSHVLEYVSDVGLAIRELTRVLRDDGALLLTENYAFGRAATRELAPTAKTMYMVRQFGDDLMQFLRDGGLQVTRFDYTGRNDAGGDYFFLCHK